MVLMSAALSLFGSSRSVIVLLAASVVAGFAGIIVLASLYVSAQQVLPNWVRARGLAILLTVVFGSAAFGSAGWGKLASASDPSNALFVAAAGGAPERFRRPRAGGSRPPPMSISVRRCIGGK